MWSWTSCSDTCNPHVRETAAFIIIDHEVFPMGLSSTKGDFFLLIESLKSSGKGHLVRPGGSIEFCFRPGLWVVSQFQRGYFGIQQSYIPQWQLFLMESVIQTIAILFSGPGKVCGFVISSHQQHCHWAALIISACPTTNNLSNATVSLHKDTCH